jgi:hypothetical protein
MHSHTPTALPSTPSPGLSVPDEGVSLWLRRLLQSSTLEQGLALLLSWIEEPITHGSLALWVWPDPRIEALGLIGLSRYYESRQEILGDRDPTDDELARWSFPGASDRAQVIRFPDAAILWERDSRPLMSAEEHTWFSTLIECLIPLFAMPNSPHSRSSQLGPDMKSTTRSEQFWDARNCCSVKRPTRRGGAASTRSAVRLYAFET